MKLSMLPNLPDEIVYEILTRVPSASSLWSFRCVSKSWYSLISSKKFIQTHLNKSLASSRFSLISLLPSVNVIQACDLYPLLADDNLPAPLSGDCDVIKMDCPVMNDNPRIPVPVFCTRNGLCLMLVNNRDFYLWNPFIKKVRKLPDLVHKDHKTRHIYCAAFGFDEHTDDYAVVAVVTGVEASPFSEIYSLRTDSWRRMWKFICFPPYGLGVFLDGKVHWSGIPCPNGSYKIVSFDLTSGFESRFDLPSSIDKSELERDRYPLIGTHGGCLSLLCSFITHLDFWVLKDYGMPASWVMVGSIPYYGRFWEYPQRSHPRIIYVTTEGEILLSQLQTIILYNPKTNSFRHPRLFDSFPKADICIQSLVSPFPDGTARERNRTGYHGMNG